MTAGWTLDISPRATRDIHRLDPSVRERVLDSLAGMVATPSHGDLRRLEGTVDEWRLRVGDWRARLRPNARTRTVVVIRVQHRSSVYRR